MRGLARIAWGLAPLLALVGACHRAPTSTPGESGSETDNAWPSAPDEGYVLLPWGTRVYVEPRYGALSAVLNHRPVHRPHPWPAFGFVAKVEGSRDGFVEVRPLPRSAGSHCSKPLDGEDLDVRLYVSPWSLAQVLREPHKVSFEDGTSVELGPGALVRPIEGDPEERYAVSAAGLDLRVPLPPEALGRSYEQPKAQILPSSSQWVLDQASHLLYDEQWRVGVSPREGHAVIESVLPLSGRYRVEIVSGCARVVAMAPSAPPERPEEPQFHHFDFGFGAPPMSGSTGGVQEPEPVIQELVELEEFAEDFGVPVIDLRTVEFEDSIEGELLLPDAVNDEFIVEAGAPVYLSPAGPPSGMLTKMRVFSSDLISAADRMCFRTPFSAHFFPMLGVCVDAAEARPRSPKTDPNDFGPGFVVPTELRVSAGLDEALVAQALRRHRHELRGCYREALGKKPQQTATLSLTLDTDAAGTVTQARLRSSWLGALSDCAVRVAQSWSMPPTTDGDPGRFTFTVDLRLSDAELDPG